MNHGRHFRRILATLAVACLLILGQSGRAASAEATIIYTFTTTLPAPLAGPVNGAFSVSDSAILNSFITASEITSFDFILPSAMSLFAPATFAPPDVLAIFSPFAGAVAVDTITGVFTADALIQITDSSTTQRLGLTTFPGTVPPLVPQYQVIIGTGPSEQSTQGSGAWTVSRVSEPHSIVLVGGGILGLFGFGRLRSLWQRHRHFFASCRVHLLPET
jgi:hypothetical protein